MDCGQSMSLNPQVDQKKNIYIYIYMIGPEEGRFVRSKYKRKLKLCHLFICVLLFTSCLEKPSTQHLMFLWLIVTFDQIRKNWWRISCAGRKKRFHGVVGKENVTICGGFTRWNQLRIAWKCTKTVILLGLAGYELIITNSAYGLVSYIYQLISGASSKNNC